MPRVITNDGSSSLILPINKRDALSKSADCIVDIKKAVTTTRTTNINISVRTNRKINTEKSEKNATKESRRKVFPWFTMIILIIQAFMYMKKDTELINSFCYSPRKRQELWRVVTYSFLHADACHIALNSANLIIFGATLEREQGFLKAALIYLTGVIAGALGFDFLDRTQRMIGASGACSAFLMAQLAYLIINWNALEFWRYRKACVISFALSDIISGPLSKILRFEDNFSWSTHMSAGVNGFLLGTLILDSKLTNNLVKLRYIISAIYGILLEILIIQYVPSIRDALYQHSKRYDS